MRNPKATKTKHYWAGFTDGKLSWQRNEMGMKIPAVYLRKMDAREGFEDVRRINITENEYGF